jgi:hypothetical protein
MLKFNNPVKPHTKARLGFVITSHTNDLRLDRLLRKLNQLYESPPVIIHHDFSQSSLPLIDSKLPPNVTVLKRHYKTRWAHISVIDAVLTSVEELYCKYAPDWFAYLSTACYPVALGSSVLTEISETEYDGFVGYYQLWPEVTYPPASPIDSIGEILLCPALPTHSGDVATWLKAAYHRYVSTDRSGTLFGPHYRCFVGDSWFTANAKAAAVLITSRREHCDLFYHYTNVCAPEESYYATVLCNDGSLNLCANNKRFANWQTPEAHPLLLTMSDMENMLASKCHFARKVSLEKSADLLHALDELHLASEMRLRESAELRRGFTDQCRTSLMFPGGSLGRGRDSYWLSRRGLRRMLVRFAPWARRAGPGSEDS